MRVAQGLTMATAFAMTLAYLGEQCTMRAAPAAFAAYVTGNVLAGITSWDPRSLTVSQPPGAGQPRKCELCIFLQRCLVSLPAR